MLFGHPKKGAVYSRLPYITFQMWHGLICVVNNKFSVINLTVKAQTSVNLHHNVPNSQNNYFKPIKFYLNTYWTHFNCFMVSHCHLIKQANLLSIWFISPFFFQISNQQLFPIFLSHFFFFALNIVKDVANQKQPF